MSQNLFEMACSVRWRSQVLYLIMVTASRMRRHLRESGKIERHRRMERISRNKASLRATLSRKEGVVQKLEIDKELWIDRKRHQEKGIAPGTTQTSDLHTFGCPLSRGHYCWMEKQLLISDL